MKTSVTDVSSRNTGCVRFFFMRISLIAIFSVMCTLQTQAAPQKYNDWFTCMNVEVYSKMGQGESGFTGDTQFGCGRICGPDLSLCPVNDGAEKEVWEPIGCEPAGENGLPPCPDVAATRFCSTSFELCEQNWTYLDNPYGFTCCFQFATYYCADSGDRCNPERSNDKKVGLRLGMISLGAVFSVLLMTVIFRYHR